jgi:coenzyme F420-reducing hydrogenase beta subunit
MIKVTEKSQCCGCGACVTVCPTRCVSLVSDDEGFGYPVVDSSRCADCGLCGSVCPFLATYTPNHHPQAFAAKHRDEGLRLESSSGGAFTALAEQTIRAGGVVFGAAWDSDWLVSHTYTETIDGLSAFRGSKYLQSRPGESYRQAKAFLDAGRKVLYSGTPCQIAGLTRYLNRPYANLLAVDVACHGVPSPKVFQAWLCEILKNQGVQSSNIKEIAFKSKVTPYHWRNAGFVVEYNDGVSEKKYVESTYQGAYGRGFLADLYLRPSCHACVVKGKEYGSDLTLADFWGVERILPDFDDDKGVSLVFVNSGHGRRALDAAVATCLEVATVEYDDILRLCPMVARSVQPHRNRAAFFKDFLLGQNAVKELIARYATKTFRQRSAIVLHKCAYKLGVVHLVRKIRGSCR